MTEKIDSRLIKAIEDADLEYSIAEGRIMICLGLGEERTQAVYIENDTYEYDGVEMRAIWSVGYLGNYPDPTVLVYCLEKNASYKIGAWQASFSRESDSCTLVFCAKVGATLDGKHLHKVVSSVSIIADELEQKLSASDKF